MWAVLQGNDSHGIPKSQVPKITRSSPGPNYPRDVGGKKGWKKEIQRRESSRKEIEFKNEFRRIQREEKEKQEGQKPKDRMTKTMGEEILEIKEKREKNG